MDPKNKSETLPSIRVAPAMMAKIEERADAIFGKVPDAVRELLEEALAGGKPIVKTAAQEFRERKEMLALADMERDAARRAELLLWREDVEALFSDIGAAIRTQISQLPASVMGLDPRQRAELDSAVAAVLTSLSDSMTPQAIDDLVKKCAVTE
jgi:hypothetical protein